MCFAGAKINENDVTDEEFYNMTDKISYEELNLTHFKESGDKQNNSFIVRTVGKYADFIMFAGIEGSKQSMIYGYENPQYNYDFAWKLLFLTCFASLLIPIIHLLLFIGYGIYNLKEIIRKKLRKIEKTQKGGKK